MKQYLPHLNALRTLEVTVRHKSVKLAAEELNVTPAAVSHQIRKIEEFFDTSLFYRQEGRLEPTNIALSALPKLQEGFQSISAAVQQLRAAKGTRTLRVLAPPLFAAKWLAPRLNRFLVDRPEVVIDVSTSEQLISVSIRSTSLSVPLKQREIDIAVVLGSGPIPGCRTSHLMSVEAVPLCSPALLNQENLRKPADLARITLLHDDTRYPENPSWADWYAAAGLDATSTSRGIHFDHAMQALEAAIEGQGVALSLRPLAAVDIAAGRLVVPFDIALSLRISYLVVEPDEPADDHVVAVRDWMLSEAAND